MKYVVVYRIILLFFLSSLFAYDLKNTVPISTYNIYINKNSYNTFESSQVNTNAQTQTDTTIIDRDDKTSSLLDMCKKIISHPLSVFGYGFVIGHYKTRLGECIFRMFPFVLLYRWYKTIKKSKNKKVKKNKKKSGKDDKNYQNCICCN